MSLITDPSKLFPYFSARGGKTDLTPGQVTPIIGAEPQRVLLVLSQNTTVAAIQIGPTGVAELDAGIFSLSVSGSAPTPKFIRYRDWGAITGWGWSGVTSGISAVWWIQIIFTPPQDWSQQQIKETIESLGEFDAGIIDEITQAAI